MNKENVIYVCNDICIYIYIHTHTYIGFPGGSVVKNLLQCRSHGRCRFDPWKIGKVPWRRTWQPTPLILPRESHGQRNLVGYNP